MFFWVQSPQKTQRILETLNSDALNPKTFFLGLRADVSVHTPKALHIAILRRRARLKNKSLSLSLSLFLSLATTSSSSRDGGEEVHYDVLRPNARGVRDAEHEWVLDASSSSGNNQKHIERLLLLLLRVVFLTGKKRRRCCFAWEEHAGTPGSRARPATYSRALQR